MTINENLSKRDMHREKERSGDKLRSFARTYGKSVESDVDYAELEAKVAETLIFPINPVENTQNDPKPSLQEYIDLLNKGRKIDPNSAFKERKRRKAILTIDDVISSLRKDSA